MFTFAFVFLFVLKECKATPVTVEPLFGQKAAVLSVIVRLPRGDEDYTPLDQSGLAIGSALVTLGMSLIHWTFVPGLLVHQLLVN